LQVLSPDCSDYYFDLHTTVEGVIPSSKLKETS
jgi:hypothetical protein